MVVTLVQLPLLCSLFLSCLPHTFLPFTLTLVAAAELDPYRSV